MIDLKNILLQKKYKILLIGDDCVDFYQHGIVERLSPEAPVPIFKKTKQISLPGMASNVEENLKALGCEVISYKGAKSTKTRLIDQRSHYHIVRIDDDVISTALDYDQISFSDVDAIVISDYDKGYVSYDLIEKIIKNSFCPVFIDTKKQDLSRFEGAIVKINELEYSKIKSECSDLIITRGSKDTIIKNLGMSLPAAATEVVDVTGAGDTFLSALSVGFLATYNTVEAVKFANKASAVTVRHFGVYAPSLEEIG